MNGAGKIALEVFRRNVKSESAEQSTVSNREALPSGFVVGVLSGFAKSNQPLVTFAENKLGHPVRARSTIPLNAGLIGREVIIIFERGILTQPIILGCIQDSDAIQQDTEIKLDSELLTFTAEKEIVLRCGESSLTLTRAGKVLIRGTYVLSRSSGANCIKGGSVQIN